MVWTTLMGAWMGAHRVLQVQANSHLSHRCGQDLRVGPKQGGPDGDGADREVRSTSVACLLTAYLGSDPGANNCGLPAYSPPPTGGRHLSPHLRSPHPISFLPSLPLIIPHSIPPTQATAEVPPLPPGEGSRPAPGRQGHRGGGGPALLRWLYRCGQLYCRRLYKCGRLYRDPR